VGGGVQQMVAPSRRHSRIQYKIVSLTSRPQMSNTDEVYDTSS